MTDIEKLAWIAAYAIAWFQPTAGQPGVVADEYRAHRAAVSADRALEALRNLPPTASRFGREVLR